MYLSALVLVLLIAVPLTYARVTQRYADEIRTLESELSVFAVQREDKKEEVARLAEEEGSLRRERVALMEAGFDTPSLESPKPTGKPGSPEEYLVAVGLATHKDLEKARRYKSGSRSEHDLGEILVMMDVIDSSDWAFAVSKVAAVSTP